MKLKLFFLSLLAVVCLTGQARDLRHLHQPESGANQEKMTVPGYCEIEVINRSYEPIHVTGQFLHGEYLTPFDIYPYEIAHYISVYYYGCQSGMNLTIQNFNGYVMYSGYTPVYQTLVIYPSFNKAANVKTSSKR